MKKPRQMQLEAAYAKLEEAVQLLNDAGEDGLADQVHRAADGVDVVATGEDAE